MKKILKESTTYVVNDDKSKKEAEEAIKKNATMNSVEKQQAISSLRTAKKGDKIITKEEKQMEFQEQYERLKNYFIAKGWDTSLERLETIKHEPVKLLKVYNAYFRNPRSLNEQKVRKYISEQLVVLLREAGFDIPDLGLGNDTKASNELPTEKDILLQKFPQLKEALVSVMGKDFNQFIDDIKYVAPKPTTFKVVMNVDESFNLFWTGEKIGWICEVAGKKYHLLYQNEKQQAIKAINRLLRIGSSSEDETNKNPVSNPVGKDDFSSPEGVSEPGSEPAEPLKENIENNNIKQYIKDMKNNLNEIKSLVKKRGYV